MSRKLVTMVNSLANMLIDAASKGYVSGNDLDFANECLDKVIPLLDHEVTEKGLYGKYYIQHADGTPVDKKAAYFVLRLDTDPHARKAVERYATSIFDENPLLANSLMEWVKGFK